MMWHQAVEEILGGVWPKDVVYFDIETCGCIPNDAMTLPTQLGYCIVENNEVVTKNSCVIDWALPGTTVDPDTFRIRVAQTMQVMFNKGKHCKINLDVIENEGVHPIAVLDAFYDLLVRHEQAGAWFGGFNCAHFDNTIIERVFRDHLGKSFVFPVARVIDVGLIEKARIAKVSPPIDGTLEGWYRALKKKAFVNGWSLEKCIERYGVVMDSHDAHDAEWDAYATYLVSVKMAEMAKAA